MLNPLFVSKLDAVLAGAISLDCCHHHVTIYLLSSLSVWDQFLGQFRGCPAGASLFSIG